MRLFVLLAATATLCLGSHRSWADRPPPPRAAAAASWLDSPQLEAERRWSATFHVSLEPRVGYAYFTNLFDLASSGAHGLVYGGTLFLLWPGKTIGHRSGIQVRGYYSPSMKGIGTGLFVSETTRSLDLAGASIGVIYETRLLWGTAGMGAIRFSTGDRSQHHLTFFELSASGGTQLPLGDHLALRVGLEVGTIYPFAWRFGGLASAVVTL